MERLENPPTRLGLWKWAVCGLLLLATMLNYMDRQTLSLTITDISRDLKLNNEQYGNMEFCFGMAFAAGGLAVGLLADRVSVWWLYPVILLGWSLAGVATAWADPIGRFCVTVLGGLLQRPEGMTPEGFDGYVGLLVCRTVLGCFEAGHWPCALITTQRLLSQRERAFGNSLLQSGASIGALLTPIVVAWTVTETVGGWRLPYFIIGLIGLTWIVPWLLLVRPRDLVLRPDPAQPVNAPPSDAIGRRNVILGRLLVLIIVIVTINMTWHFLRAWLPKFLTEQHGYGTTAVRSFVVAYFIATDIGCVASGWLSRKLAVRGWDVHDARVIAFFACASLTALGAVAAFLPAGPWLLGLLLLIGAGALGLFPLYYAFTQEVSPRRQGLVTGLLGAITWIVTSFMQKYVGRSIDVTGSYTAAMAILGLAPLLPLLILWLCWPRGVKERA